MYPVSQGFLRAVTHGGRLVTVADVLANGQPIARNLPVVGGNVRMRARAKIRRSCDLVVAGTGWTPKTPDDYLAPAGNEVIVRRGFIVDGIPELVPLGTFIIQKAVTDGSTVRVTAQDRSYGVASDQTRETIVTNSWTPFQQWWLTFLVVGQGQPQKWPVSWQIPDIRIPQVIVPPGTNRWDEALEWIEKVAAEARFDGNGTLVVRYPPTFQDQPVWTISDGELGTLTKLDLSMDRSGVFNILSLVAEHPSLPGTPADEIVHFTSQVFDNDPTSPTYRYGKFGEVHRHEVTDLVTDPVWLTAAARRILDSQLGALASLDLSAVPNPALEEGDPVLVVRQEVGVNQVHILEDIEIGFGADAEMKCTTRARTAPGWTE